MALEGNIGLGQIRDSILTGTGSKIVTFGGGVKTEGYVLVFDAAGNAVAVPASTIGGATSPIVDADGNPIFDANGNWILEG